MESIRREMVTAKKLFSIALLVPILVIAAAPSASAQRHVGESVRERPTGILPVQGSPLGLDGPIAFQIQSRLAALGYDVGVPDGRFGTQSRNALAKFQRDVGLAATGFPDRATAVALERAVRTQSSSAKPGVSPGRAATRGPVMPPPLATASRAIGARDVPVVQNRLALFDTYTLDTRGIGPRAGEHAADWRYLFDGLIAGRWPERLRAADDEAIRSWLSAYAAQDLFHLNSGDEFERRALLQRFRSELVPRIIADARKLPIKLVDIRRVRLHDYDFGSESFPFGISTDFARLNVAKPVLAHSLRAPLPLSAIPRRVPVPTARARQLADSLNSDGTGDRRAYLALFITITGLTEAERSPGSRPSVAVDLSLERMALFADPQLNRLVHEFDLAPVTPAPPPAVDPRVVAMTNIRTVTSDELIATIADLSRQPDFIDGVIRGHSRFTSLSELQQPRYLLEERARLSGMRQPDPWIEGTIKLGRYDREAQRFPVEAVTLRPTGSSSGSYNSFVTLALADPKAIPAIAVPLGDAQAVIDQGGSDRTFSLKVRARPVAAEIIDGPKGRLFVEPSEVYVFKSKNPRDVFVTYFRPQTEQVDRAPAAIAAPKDIPLNHETVDLLILKQDPGRLDRMAERMFYERLIYEASTDAPVWGRFFKTGQALPNLAERQRLLPQFKTWTAERARALGDRFAVRATRGGSVCGSAKTIFDAAEVPASFDLGARGTLDAELRALRSDTENADRPYLVERTLLGIDARPIFEPAGCYHSASRGIRETLGLEKSDPPKTLIVLGKVPLPAGGVYRELSSSEYAVVVDGVELVGSADTPSVLIRATAEAATHAGNRQNANVVMARLSPSAVEPLGKEIATPGALDVSGIKLGMSFAEADKVIRAHMKVGRVFEGPRAVSPDGKLQPFQTARLYMRDDAMEFFILFHEPPDVTEEVIGVIRWNIVPQLQISPDAFTQALEAKYGPRFRSQQEGFGSGTWASEAAKTAWGDCAVAISDNRQEGQWYENGVPAVWYSKEITLGPARVESWMSTPNEHLPWPRLEKQDGRAQQRCGSVIRAKFDRMRSFTDRMVIMLVDVGRATSALPAAQAMLEKAPPPKPPVSPVVEGVVKDLKL